MAGLRSIGRGGAGNHVSRTSTLEPTAPNDLEAQTQQVGTENKTETVRARPLSKSEYIHTGRGGAGNWGEPPEVVAASIKAEANTTGNSGSDGQKGKTINTAPPITRTTTTSPPPTPRDAPANRNGSMTGRGGAGNFAANKKAMKEQEAEVEKQKERERATRQEQVRDDVEAQLELPGRAFLGGKKAASGGGSWE
ncbi:MAG: hypothetical protein M4579_001989 [Chaenotheca gracillima]|nr:MAG: hypothetical protein M4579_001989 [Chaenotheca gracillima]